MSNHVKINSSSLVAPATMENYTLDYTEIDQGLNLWSEIFPMIEKEIVTLTTVAQEMQECPERQKYVDALTKIAVRVNNVEEKATTSIKETRTQLKKTKLIDKTNEISQEKISNKNIHHDQKNEYSDEDESDNEMEIDESQISEQIEVSALTTETVEKLQEHLSQILATQPNSAEPNIDADSRYAEFLECISKMTENNKAHGDDDDDDDDDANIVDHVISDKCPLTQKTFVEPVQNKKCRHKYEKQSVLKYIADKQKARRPAKCPSAGCTNILNEKDLINS